MIVKNGDFKITVKNRSGGLVKLYELSVDTSNEDKHIRIFPESIRNDNIRIELWNRGVSMEIETIKKALPQMQKYIKTRKYNTIVVRDGDDEEDEDDGNGTSNSTTKKKKASEYVYLKMDGSTWNRLKVLKTTLPHLCNLFEYAFVNQ